MFAFALFGAGLILGVTFNAYAVLAASIIVALAAGLAAGRLDVAHIAFAIGVSLLSLQSGYGIGLFILPLSQILRRLLGR
jgi:hypothetical protein